VIINSVFSVKVISFLLNIDTNHMEFKETTVYLNKTLSSVYVCVCIKCHVLSNKCYNVLFDMVNNIRLLLGVIVVVLVDSTSNKLSKS